MDNSKKMIGVAVAAIAIFVGGFYFSHIAPLAPKVDPPVAVNPVVPVAPVVPQVIPVVNPPAPAPVTPTVNPVVVPVVTVPDPIDGPAALEPGGFAIYRFTGQKCEKQKWTCEHFCVGTDGKVKTKLLKPDVDYYIDTTQKKLVLATNIVGKYRIALSGMSATDPVDESRYVEIATKTPPPIDPAVNPVVIDPTPPQPAPIAIEGYRVLIVEDASNRYQLPKAQADALLSNNVFQYLKTHCVKGPDGKTPEFRIIDKDIGPDQMKTESPLWLAAVAKAKQDANGKYPWIMISNGKTENGGVSKSFPANESELMQLLQKYEVK